MAAALASRERGFTLIEVLVAMAIFSAVMLIATVSYSGFAQLWAQRETRISTGLERVMDLELLRRSLESAFDYYVQSRDNGDWRPYFRGAGDQVRYITQSSFFLDEGGALAELAVVDGQLLYREWPLQTDYLRYGDDVPAGPRYSRVIWNGVEEVTLEYFGYLDQDAMLATVGAARSETDPRAWFPDYDAGARRLLPQQLRIRLVDGDGVRTLYFRLHSWNPVKAAFFVEQLL